MQNLIRFLPPLCSSKITGNTEFYVGIRSTKASGIEIETLDKSSVLKIGGWNFACSFYLSEITDIRADLRSLRGHRGQHFYIFYLTFFFLSLVAGKKIQYWFVALEEKGVQI